MFIKDAVVSNEKTVSIVAKQLRPLQQGEALVQMEYCSVCHTGLHAKNGFGAKVVAFDINDNKLAFTKEVGVEVTVNTLNQDPKEKVLEIIDGKGLDVVVITAVAKQPFNQAVAVVKAGSHVVAVGLPVDKMDLDIPPLVLDGIQVVGSLVGTRQDLKEDFQFAAEGKVVPKVTLRPLEDINDIMEEMEQGKFTGRMVINFTK